MVHRVLLNDPDLCGDGLIAGFRTLFAPIAIDQGKSVGNDGFDSAG
jgi:hypothetical protein